VLKKTISYENFDGETVTEEFLFNLDATEVTEFGLQLGGDGKIGTVQKKFAEIVTYKDAAGLIAMVKTLMAMAVGRKSEDGRRFTKNAEIAADFLETNAWPTLFMQMASNPEELVEFFVGVIPTAMQEDFRKGMTDETAEPAQEKVYTFTELMALSDDDFHTVAGDDFAKMTADQKMAAYARKSAA
jgi:hypothetical protein